MSRSSLWSPCLIFSLFSFVVIGCTLWSESSRNSGRKGDGLLLTRSPPSQLSVSRPSFWWWKLPTLQLSQVAEEVWRFPLRALPLGVHWLSGHWEDYLCQVCAYVWYWEYLWPTAALKSFPRPLHECCLERILFSLSAKWQNAALTNTGSTEVLCSSTTDFCASVQVIEVHVFVSNWISLWIYRMVLGSSLFQCESHLFLLSSHKVNCHWWHFYLYQHGSCLQST